MASRRKKIQFDLLDSTFEGLPEESETAVVVSFFGKSFWDSDGCKYDCFKSLKRKSTQPDHLPQVDGVYDPEARVIYLQLRGVLDVKVLVKAVSGLQSELNEKGYLSTWADLKVEYAKTLLLLFSISHIIVLSHPTPVFQISFLHLFRALENARKEKRVDFCQALTGIPGLGKDWLESGRPCSPRLLFRFLSCSRQVTDVRQLEHAVEDQIYHVLKRQKVISGKSANSLFAIPANQEFVFVESAFERPGNRLITSVQNIVHQCLNPPVTPLSFNLNHLSVEEELQETVVHKFEKFLSSHIEVALSKGLSDNVGRHLPPAPFTLPTPQQFLKVARALIPHTSGENSEGTCCAALRTCLDVDRQFSEGRCAKVLPLALAAYQENSLPHYPRRYHETRLAQAMAVLAMQGRGAMMDKYVAELEQQCNAYWQNGRQMCETLSLTGHPCINAIHRGGGEGAGGGESPEDRKTEGLEDKEHCSGLRYLSACNCGRKQGQRPDPYTLKTANFEFYRTLAAECVCDKLDAIKFPVFQPSVKDFRAAQLLGRRESLAMLRGDLPRSQMGGGTQHENFSLAFVSGQSIHGSCDPAETRLSCLRTQHPDILILTNQPGDPCKDKSLVRQASTTEYLPGMLHAESPTGLLPQFASWSLVCVGPSSVYSHNLGLNEQPGLLPGSSYLLPWDVTVRLEHQKKNIWPTVADTKRVGSQIRVRKNKGEQSEMVVKIFVGVEYECTRGHRFMTAASDKVLKTGPSGQVRDTGHKVASSDMPLYFPCPCSKPNKPVVAQLLRLHIVTPKAPVIVTLNPRVEAAPNSPIFVACQDQPIPLTQSTYWVLRLPYVYMAERSPYVAPLEVPGPMYGRLLAGTFGITEIPPENS